MKEHQEKEKKWLVVAVIVVTGVLLIIIPPTNNLYDFLSSWVGTPNENISLKEYKWEFLFHYGALVGGLALIWNFYSNSRRAEAMEKTLAHQKEHDGKALSQTIFDNAVKNLGNENTSVRLGGVYALYDLAKNDKNYQSQVFDILLAYIREKTNEEGYKKHYSCPLPEEQRNRNNRKTYSKPSIEIQTLLDLLLIGKNSIFELDSSYKINLTNANLNGAVLRKAHLRGAYLNYAHLNDAVLTGAELNVSNLNYASLNGAYLNCASLNVSSLNYAHLNGAVLTGAKLRCAEFHYAHLNGAVLTEAELNGAYLFYASLNGAVLRKAHLNGAYLNYAHLNGAVLTEAELNGANLNYASLNGACLNYASLNGALLRKAHLNDACLSLAHLKGAILTDAHLNFANLKGAVFDKAKIAEAYFIESTVLESNLEDAKGINFAYWKGGISEEYFNEIMSSLKEPLPYIKNQERREEYQKKLEGYEERLRSHIGKEPVMLYSALYKIMREKLKQFLEKKSSDSWSKDDISELITLLKGYNFKSYEIEEFSKIADFLEEYGSWEDLEKKLSSNPDEIPEFLKKLTSHLAD